MTRYILPQRLISKAGSTILFVAVLILPGCGKNNKPQEIVEKRFVTGSHRRIKSDATSVERFSDFNAPSGQKETDADIPLIWDIPPDWETLPRTRMRYINFRVAGHHDAECYLTIIPGKGGGIAENVNRWRRQFSLPVLSEEEIRSLPTRNLLRHKAVYIEIEGTFYGMRNDFEKINYKLIGLILSQAGGAVFVKMVGPSEVLDAEKKNFKQFYTSLRVSDVGNNPSGPSAAEGLEWKAPHRWQLQPDLPMRLVSYLTGDRRLTECYITILAGDGGGIAANVNRWYGQMARPALSENKIKQLDKLHILEQHATLVEIKGDFSGMVGPTRPDYMLLGVLSQIPEKLVSIKMIGPENEVQKERENFIKFCKSLKFVE